MPPKEQTMRGLASLLAISLFAVAIDAEAGRRSLRIEFEDFGWSRALPLGSGDCPGSAQGSPGVFWRGIQFSGGSGFATHNVDEYCQLGIEYDADNPDTPYLNESLFFAAEDDGTPLWEGSSYAGEIWCFNGSSFVGTWDGAPAGASPLTRKRLKSSIYPSWRG